MYFDPKPKERLADFYNYRQEYESVKNAIIGDDYLIVLKGLRRTGKTSLMKIVCNTVAGERIWIDVRSVSNLEKALAEELFSKVKELSSLEKLASLIEGLNLYVVLKKKERSEHFYRLIEQLEKLLLAKKTSLMVFIDEVQLFPSISRIIAYILDNSRRIKFVVSGSEIGMVDRFLGEQYESALFGRAKLIVEMKHLPEEKSVEFLKKGANGADFTLSQHEVEEAVKTFNGTIGWLTLYGFYAKKYGHAKAIREVIKDGKKTVAHELNKFLANKGEAAANYIKILKLLASDRKKWSEIKLLVNIDDKKNSKYLNTLVAYGFIKKEDEFYFVSDPVLKEYLRA